VFLSTIFTPLNIEVAPVVPELTLTVTTLVCTGGNGAIVSEMLDVPTLPAASYARASIVWEPTVAALESQRNV